MTSSIKTKSSASKQKREGKMKKLLKSAYATKTRGAMSTVAALAALAALAKGGMMAYDKYKPSPQSSQPGKVSQAFANLQAKLAPYTQQVKSAAGSNIGKGVLGTGAVLSLLGGAAGVRSMYKKDPKFRAKIDKLLTKIKNNPGMSSLLGVLGLGGGALLGNVKGSRDAVKNRIGAIMARFNKPEANAEAKKAPQQEEDAARDVMGGLSGIGPNGMKSPSRKSVKKSRKVSRKSRKTSKKSRKLSMKSRKASKKSRKVVRKSRKASKKVARKVVRKSRKLSMKSRKASKKVARKISRKSRKASKKSRRMHKKASRQ